MSAATPLVFRPSPAHRTVTALLCAGSLLAGLRGLMLLAQNLPRLLFQIRMAAAAGEGTAWLKTILVADCAALLAGGALLILSVLTLLVVEGTQVITDEVGLAIELTTLPNPVARRLGAGRLGWKQIHRLEKGPVFFRLRGKTEAGSPLPALRFLVVDHLDRLIHLIIERSPNLAFED